MDLNSVKAGMEAVLFAHADPLTAERLAGILEIEVPLCERLLISLKDDYSHKNRGIQLIRLEDAWQLTTKDSCSKIVQKALDTRRNVPLSSAALEVLAIVAYNQPVSRSFIEQVRGVDSSSTVSKLVEKGLVCEAGRLDLPGKPLSYRTTDLFLRSFGISSLSQLPLLQHEDEVTKEGELFHHPNVLPNFSEADDIPATKSLHGGMYIEGEKGTAMLAVEEDEPWSPQ